MKSKNELNINLGRTMMRTRTYPSALQQNGSNPHAILTTSTVYLIIVIFIKARPPKGRQRETERKVRGCKRAKNERGVALNK